MAVFDEKTLQDQIHGLWGAHGAHAEVYGMLLARVAELETVLDRMRRDGCGLASPIHPGSSEFGTCREKFPGEPDEWCWSCQAHAALNSQHQLEEP